MSMNPESDQPDTTAHDEMSADDVAYDAALDAAVNGTVSNKADAPDFNAPDTDTRVPDASDTAVLDLAASDTSIGEHAELFTEEELALLEAADHDTVSLEEAEPDTVSASDHLSPTLPSPAAAALPTGPMSLEDFFSAGPDLGLLDVTETDARTGVLERLGPAHFRSKEFRFMGFLQTVYNHVAEQVSGVSDDSSRG